MMPVELAELARALDGRVVGQSAPVGPQVVIDSRLATPGSLFVALAGERVDGHDFIASAAAAGAAAAMVQRVPADAEALGLPLLVVTDTLKALGQLGRFALEQSNAEVIGITGSAGKTTTKDLLAHLLEAEGPTIAPIGSYNNEYGLPLTATRVDAQTRWLISEMGARGIGHIAELCRLTPPTVGAVLNVGTAHLGEFGGQDEIAIAKGELVEALPGDGWAVLNAGDPRVAAMVTRTSARLAWWMIGARPQPGGDLRVWSSQGTSDRLDRHSFLLNVEAAGESVRQAPVTLTTSGGQQVPNALAAATCALVLLGPDHTEQIAGLLSTAVPRSRWRMELSSHGVPGGDVLLVNDAYNASPDTMTAALNSLNRLARGRFSLGGRSIAVLGDMLELGSAVRSEHEAVGRAAGASKVDLLIAVGEYAQVTSSAATAAGVPDVRTRMGDTSANRRDVAAEIAAEVRPGDTVLVKASRGQQLQEVALELAATLDRSAEAMVR